MSVPTPTAPPYDQPPTYEQSSSTDAPPSYDELFGEFRQVSSAGGLMDFLKRAWSFIGNTVAAMIALAFLNVIPLAMIFIGAINMDRCPVEEMIPKWLIITGLCSLSRSAINFFVKIKHKNHAEQVPGFIKTISALLDLFNFVWFILGSVWVYWAYGKTDYNPDNRSHFCDQFTMMFSFILITATYVFVFLTCFCFCCCCCCICFKKRPDLRVPPV